MLIFEQTILDKLKSGKLKPPKQVSMLFGCLVGMYPRAQKLLQKFFEKNFVHQKKYIKYFDTDLIAFIYKNSTIKDIQYKPKGMRFEYSLSKKNAQKFISLEKSQ